jgi:PAS domain S-box-containing protein
MTRVKRKKSRKRPTIGYLMDWPHDPAYQALWAGVHDAACKHDANLICFLGGRLQHPHLTHRNAIYDLVTPETLDGLIVGTAALATDISAEELEAFCHKYDPLPMVGFQRPVAGLSSVVVDNVAGVRSVIAHLVETHDHRRIAFIRGPESHQEAEQRYDAYAKVLAEYEIPLDPEIVTPGDFTQAAGMEAVRLLLDERKLEPGTSFGAIAAANDAMAVGALTVLQSRGIRVPEDVALVGFDDSLDARYSLPPLTTVINPFHEMGFRATEMLLAKLDGGDAPEQVVLPLQLTVRRSCGCPLPVVAWTAEEPGIHLPAEMPDGKASLSANRESILSELTRAMSSLDGAKSTQIEAFLDAFIVDIEKGKTGFLAVLKDILHDTAASGADAFTWQDALTGLRLCALPHLSSDDVVRAELILDQARVLVGDIAHRVLGHQAVAMARWAQTLHEISSALITRFDLEELLDTAVQQLPRTGLSSFYIALYEDPAVPAEQSRLILACVEGKRVGLADDEQVFPSRQLMPEGLLLPKRRFSLVVEPLYVPDRQLGFALFEAEPSQGESCEALRGQISSALSGVILLQARDEAVEARAQAYAEVEKQVEERTTELQQEIAERTRAEAIRARAEQDLKESEVRYRAIVEDQTELICRILPDGTLTFVNEAFCRYTGKERQDLVGRPLMESASAEDHRAFRDLFASLTVENPVATYEHSITLPSGDVSWLRWTSRAIFDDPGHLIEFQSVGVDITERKRAEAERERLVRALEMRSTHLQTAAEVSHAASSILDPDELMQQAVEVVSKRLALYYAGLFLVDRSGEWAVLSAGTGEAGRLMVEQGYTVPVDEDTNAGWCIANQQARIVSAQDEEEGRLMSHPLLPETRSQLALPLISRGQAIGAMVFHSSEEFAFSEEDVGVFQAMADQLANAIANARLFDRAQRDLTERKEIEDALKHRLEQLAALSQASQAMTTFLEPDQVLAEIVSLANGVVDSDYTGVILVDEANNVGQSMENLPGVKALKYRIREEGLTRWIVRHRRAAVIDEIGQDGTVFPSLGEGAPSKANPLIVRASIKSFAGLPLMVKDRLLGVLYLHSLRPNAFGGQLFLLSAFANQVAIAIENARLFQNEQQQTQRLALLAEVARITATTFDPDALLQGVADCIFRHFDYPRVGLFTLDESERELLLRGRSSSTIAVEELAVPGFYRLSVDEGISGYVARTGKPHLARDVSTDPYFVNPTRAPTASALGVPIFDEERVVGTVLVESEQREAFDNQDLSLLEAVADTVAIGLRNARLYQETRRRVQELTLLNRISVGPGIALDLDRMIEDTFEELQGLVDADRVSFISVDLDAGSWEITHTWAAPGLESHTQTGGPLADAEIELNSLTASQPFAVSDTRTDPRIEATRELYHQLNARAALLTPVQVGGRLHGILGFTKQDERHVWHPDETRLSETIATQLALVVENAHLFEETQLRAEELAIALARLEELDHLKDEFIQNVSHELRSPLALVRGYAEMLDGGELGDLAPDQRMPVAVIARRARMLSDLVKDITMILEAEVSPPDPEPVLWDELAQNAVEDFQVAAQQADLTLRAEIAPDLPPVCGAPTYLRRVLDNLLGNAVKFTPAGGTITVRLHRDEDFVALEVSDTGVGIPADKLARIFERFYQVDGSASRRFGGMGLGLALVKQIVEAYEGHVMVESQVGHGSTFRALLPAFAGAEEGGD